MLYKIYRIIISFLPSKLYAHLLGVKIGPNTFIATKNWSWEPYLITIGSNCQITKFSGAVLYSGSGCRWFIICHFHLHLLRDGCGRVFL